MKRTELTAMEKEEEAWQLLLPKLQECFAWPDIAIHKVFFTNHPCR